MLLDENDALWECEGNKKIRGPIDDFQKEALVAHQTIPWNRDERWIASDVGVFRILVLGNSGVGKSSLINAVFGDPMVRGPLSSPDLQLISKTPTENWERGEHDIEEELELSSRPGLLIHDSKGPSAGSDSELKQLRKFVADRSREKDVKKRLHAIWFVTRSPA